MVYKGILQLSSAHQNTLYAISFEVAILLNFRSRTTYGCGVNLTLKYSVVFSACKINIDSSFYPRIQNKRSFQSIIYEKLCLYFVFEDIKH
jgi:hypothetical protein